jgi:YD repeat-containing protein
MNKKLYLLVLGAASLALQPVNARSQFTKKQVAKVVNTDVAISLATSSDSDHTVIIVPNIISVVKPADMPVVSFGSKKEDQLLGCDVIYNSDSLNVLPTRTFDEKGRLAYVKSPDGSYERYVYTEDQQGRTVSEDKYEHKASDEAGKETLLCSKTYGYDHLVGDDTDGKAYLMKEITYGVDYFFQIHYISKIKEYNWYEAGNCFVLTGQKNNIKVTVEINGDVCEATAWKREELKDGWGNWSKIIEQVWNVTDNSTIHKDYRYGSSSVSGNKKEVTSANGYTTIINYNYSADKGGSWILTDKTVKTDNYDDPWIYDGKHRECITYTYDREKKEFIQNRYDAYDWIRQNPNILQWTYKYGGDMTRRFLEYDDAGNLVNYDGVYPFKDGRYCSEIYKHIGSSSQELDEITWVYYATDGKEEARYRLCDVDASNRPTKPLEIFKNGKWEKFAIPDETFKLELGDYELCPYYEFNKDGYVTKNQKYDSDGGYLLTYTYTENGYTRKRKDCYKGPDSYDMKECYIDDKGTYHEVELEYEDGEKNYGHKRSLTSDGIEFTYSWSYENNDFDPEPRTSVFPITVENNGVSTTIYRDLQDGKIVETSKREETNNENGSTTITYDKVGDEWQPSSKEESSYVAKPQFALIMPSSPVKAYNSSAYICDIDSTFFADKSDLSSHANYTWDASSDSWKADYVNESTCNVEGNTLTYTVKNNYIESIISYTRDNDNRLIQYTENSSTATRAAANTSLIKDFEYDKKGRLASVTITTDHVEKYVMKYGDEATGINPVVAAPVSAIHISVSGKMITAEGCKQLALYSLDGKKLAASQNATIMAPTTGVFIIVADGKKIKMVIR